MALFCWIVMTCPRLAPPSPLQRAFPKRKVADHHSCQLLFLERNSMLLLLLLLLMKVMKMMMEMTSCKSYLVIKVI